MTTDTTPKDADRAALAEEAKRIAVLMAQAAAHHEYATQTDRTDELATAGKEGARYRELCAVLDRLASLPSQAPPAVDAQELAALAGWLRLQALQWESSGLPEDNEDLRAVRKWAAAIDRLTAPRPASDADIAEHMRLVVEYAGLHFLATRTGDPTASKAARAAVEASARKLAKGR